MLKVNELLEAGTITQEIADILNLEFTNAIKGFRTQETRLKDELKTSLTTATQLEAELNALKEKPTDDTPNAKMELMQKKLSELTTSLENEKIAKAEQIKQAELLKLVGSINGLNKDFSEDVEARLAKNLKIEDGTVFFEVDGVKTAPKDYLDNFMATNTKYLASSGVGGAGSSTGTVTSGKARAEMTSDEIFDYISKNGKDAYLNLK